MTAATLGLSGFEPFLAELGRTETAKHFLGRAGIALPYMAASVVGITFLLASAGSTRIKVAGWGVAAGGALAAAIAIIREALRVGLLSADMPQDQTIYAFVDAATLIGAITSTLAACFGLRVALVGNTAFVSSEAKRVSGRRAIHGSAKWMRIADAMRMFPQTAGMVIGEAYRVDHDDVAGLAFRADRRDSWGKGGRLPLLCFDGSFGSSHGIVFAGSGGFKTTSVTVPTALAWPGTLIVLDPSGEVAPMVAGRRRMLGHEVYVLDPKHPTTGFNVLDWIGRFGDTKEQDIAAIAAWLVPDRAQAGSGRDDFFRSSALQLLTSLIADVCLSDREGNEQTLRQVRANLAEPEQKLRGRLKEIYESSSSAFLRQNVAAFVEMTPETFSGVHANAIKETHWLSYPNYAAMISASSFSTDEIATGAIDVFITIDLKTLENHAGLARVVIGSLLNAIYNRHGAFRERTLFLLDEAARLGYMRILETARDVGRKYGITLMMLFQSIGQMRESYGGREAASKWFESASWISFAAINDPETADYISQRCGMTTVETDQVSHSSQARGSSRTRSKQLSAKPLIQPHEVLLMRTDEQIIFTAGNPPLRCGRAIWFRRRDMVGRVGANQYHGRNARR